MKYVMGLLLAAMAMGASLRAADSGLQKDLAAKYQDLKKFLTSVPGNAEDIRGMSDVLKQIKAVEGKNGITELQKELGALRIESCQIQQSNKEIKGHLTQIEALAKEVKQQTAKERGQVDKLTKASKKFTKKDPKRKQYQAAIKKIENEMKEKVADQLNKIDELNNKIYALMPDQFAKAKPIAEKMAAKYKALDKEMKAFDKKLSGYLATINKRLKTHSTRLKKDREAIKALHIKIAKADPCFAAKESMKDMGWLEFFV